MWRHRLVCGFVGLSTVAGGAGWHRLPLAQVDSVRVGHPVTGFWKTLGLVIGIPLAVLGVLCGFDGSGCYPET